MPAGLKTQQKPTLIFSRHSRLPPGKSEAQYASICRQQTQPSTGKHTCVVPQITKKRYWSGVGHARLPEQGKYNHGNEIYRI